MTFSTRFSFWAPSCPVVLEPVVCAPVVELWPVAEPVVAALPRPLEPWAGVTPELPSPVLPVVLPGATGPVVPAAAARPVPVEAEFECVVPAACDPVRPWAPVAPVEVELDS